MEIRRFTIDAAEIRLVNRAAKSVDDEDDNEDTEKDEDESQDRSVEGYAAVFNSDSEDLGGFIERLAPTAFNRSLGDADQNIYMLWGHDVNQPIGSTNSKSLGLSADKTGLRFKLDASRLNAQQLAAVVAGEMRMSFGFCVSDDSWEQTPTGDYIRTINDLDLFETSLVISPAYPATSAGIRHSGDNSEAKRSLDAFKASQMEQPTKYESRRVELKLRAAQLLGNLIKNKNKN